MPVNLSVLQDLRKPVVFSKCFKDLHEREPLDAIHLAQGAQGTSRTKCESLVSRRSRDIIFVNQPRRAKRVLVASSLCDPIPSTSSNHFLFVKPSNVVTLTASHLGTGHVGSERRTSVEP